MISLNTTMRHPLRGISTAVLGKLGYSLIRTRDRLAVTDFTGLEDDFLRLYDRCKTHTMTSVPRMYALYCAVKYVVNHDIPGDFVECGVWKGGSSMLVALTLLSLHQTTRRLYLYDTYAGMSEPTDHDVTQFGQPAYAGWKENQHGGTNDWMRVSLEEVTRNLYSTGYPPSNLTFVKGKVEDTIPGTIPDQIAVLRLDTDWYESTRHELIHLYPKLSEHGVLILDDYGFWKGAREATDEYFRQHQVPMLLNRVDVTARIGVKPGASSSHG